jgi:hypothetical protein
MHILFTIHIVEFVYNIVCMYVHSFLDHSRLVGAEVRVLHGVQSVYGIQRGATVGMDEGRSAQELLQGVLLLGRRVREAQEGGPHLLA